MIESTKHQVAVIIINYNSGEYTINCINSIIEKTAPSLNYQIIIVDNASKVEDINQVELHLNKLKNSKIQLVKSKINTGFGGGNMIGVEHANATYLAFVNNDSLLKNDCLSILKNEMDLDQSIGICGPLCHNEKGDLLPTLDYFASPIKEILGRKLMHKINPVKYPSRTDVVTKKQKGPFVAGSFMMVRTDDFLKVDGFDTNLFLYYEETDLCKRLAKINKSAYLITDAQFIHYHGVSTPQSIAIKTELKRSFLYVIKKHYGFFWHQILLNKLRIQFLFKSIFKPKYWPIFKELLVGMPMKNSLKYKQKTNV